MQNLDADTPQLGRDGVRHRVEWQGDRLKWTVYQLLPPRHRPGKRKPCAGFSEASRFSMLCRINSIDWKKAGKCAFLTVTYPDRYYMCEAFQYSDHRSRLWGYVESNQEKQVSALWRTEWKCRQTGVMTGALYPHVHYIAFDVKRLTNKFLNQAWSKAIGFDDYVNTDVRQMENKKQVAAYVAKYAAKSQCILGIASNLIEIPIGRAWGILRRNRFPQAKLWVGAFKDSAMTDDMRGKALAGRPAINQYGNESFTLLGNLAKCIGSQMAGDFVDGEVSTW